MAAELVDKLAASAADIHLLQRGRHLRGVSGLRGGFFSHTPVLLCLVPQSLHLRREVDEPHHHVHLLVLQLRQLLVHLWDKEGVCKIRSGESSSEVVK